MGKEIERKFKVLFLPYNLPRKEIIQGYIQTEKRRSVRIRTIDSKEEKRGTLTIKGEGNKSGISRFEFEMPISIQDANLLLNLCDQPLIKKTRYFYEYYNLRWEIDQFHEENEGLLLAELELKSEQQKYKKPNFIGEEVTGKEKYYNLMLMKNPFSDWTKEPK